MILYILEGKCATNSLARRRFCEGGGPRLKQVLENMPCGTPVDRLHWSHGDATERPGDRESAFSINASPRWGANPRLSGRFRFEGEINFPGLAKCLCLSVRRNLS